jgi:hypothetical protein
MALIYKYQKGNKLMTPGIIPMDPMMNLLLDPRQIPQTGVVVDKRTNKAYYTGDQSNGSFPVLTGKNPERNANKFDMSLLDRKKSLRNTPMGYYTFGSTATKTDSDDQKYYGGLVSAMKPIEAFGQTKPKAKGLAMHRVYSDNSANPNDPEFLSRMGKLLSKSGKDNYASYGCVNCSKESYEALQKNFPKGDTLMVLDSQKE